MTNIVGESSDTKLLRMEDRVLLFPSHKDLFLFLQFKSHQKTQLQQKFSPDHSPKENTTNIFSGYLYLINIDAVKALYGTKKVQQKS